MKAGIRIAYVTSRFPKISETFILYEMVAAEEAGARVSLYPLILERPSVVHPEAPRWVARARYAPALSPSVVASNLRWLVRSPGAYLGALAAVVTGTWRNINFLAGGLAAFPKVAHYAALMERDGIDHVHCHFATHPALAGLVIHRLTGLPFSFTAHGSDLHKDRTMLDRKVAEAAVVVTISEFNRRVILDDCGDEVAGKVHVVHCGVDTGTFHPAPYEPGPSRRLKVVCVGTLHEVKGQRHLIGAAAKAVAQGLDLQLRFIGDGPDRKALEAQAEELGLSGRTRFDGALPRDEVARALREADVLAAPSVPTAEGRREGIPVVLMEGMASGLPVVSSRLSGIPELVEHGVSGLLCEPGDEDGLAAALLQLAGDPQLREAMGRAARQTVVEHFDVRTNARRLLELIEGVAA